MDLGKTKKIDLTSEDKELFISALDEFNKTGDCSVKCNVCHSAIKFEKSGSALIHYCNCGKFNGTLRSL